MRKPQDNERPAVLREIAWLKNAVGESAALISAETMRFERLKDWLQRAEKELVSLDNVEAPERNDHSQSDGNHVEPEHEEAESSRVHTPRQP